MFIRYKKIVAQCLLGVIFAGCGHLPKTDVKVVTFKNSQEIKVEKDIKLEDIEVWEAQYPEGIEKEGDLFRVKNGYEDKVVILGKVEIDLQKSEDIFDEPLLKLGFYVNDRDITNLHKYCNAGMGWSPEIFAFNRILPWNIPCYFMDSFGSEDKEDIKYRAETLLYEAKQAAQKLDGNAIVGYQIGNTIAPGVQHLNLKAWSATGLVVRIKKEGTERKKSEQPI